MNRYRFCLIKCLPAAGFKRSIHTLIFPEHIWQLIGLQWREAVDFKGWWRHAWTPSKGHGDLSQYSRCVPLIAPAPGKQMWCLRAPVWSTEICFAQLPSANCTQTTTTKIASRIRSTDSSSLPPVQADLVTTSVSLNTCSNARNHCPFCPFGSSLQTFSSDCVWWIWYCPERQVSGATYSNPNPPPFADWGLENVPNSIIGYERCSGTHGNSETKLPVASTILPQSSNQACVY